MKKQWVLTGVSVILCGVTFLGLSACTAETQPPKATDAPAATAHAASQLQDHFVSVGETVGPAVVSISVEATRKRRLRPQRRPRSGPFGNFNDDLFDRFFQDFFGGVPEQEFTQRGLGTGVIIDNAGHILTNEHVVQGADKLTVTLPDGRQFDGTIKGTDPRSDLAVIQIEADNLPVAPLGDSDTVRPGQWAIAIGNPFGWAVGGTDPTLTVGVVSAVDRNFDVGDARRDYSSLIQTDAAINPGNSGGPLVNIHGEIIGINVAIYSTTGGYQGIGFAIPANTAKMILEDLIEGKKVRYGWLGVSVQELTEDLAKYFELDSDKGVLIAKVLPDSPADKGGLQTGDVVVEIDGEAIEGVRDLLKRTTRAKVDSTMEMKVLRDGKAKQLSVKIGERPDDLDAFSAGSEGYWRGLQVSNLTPEIREQLNLRIPAGVVVVEVVEGSPAKAAGLREGEVILEVDRKPIDSVEAFAAAVKGLDDQVLLRTAPRGYVIVEPESKEE